ncbi:MAG: hypothetical protein H0V44_08840, partial [Planctomycetes bacterium]|nr:hypothetical protein [Planctomycetota bacterium]
AGATKIDHRSDIYALGATILRALAAAVDTSRITRTGRGHDVRALARCGCSAELVELVTAMLADDPAARPATWEDVISRSRHLPSGHRSEGGSAG